MGHLEFEDGLPYASILPPLFNADVAIKLILFYLELV